VGLRLHQLPGPARRHLPRLRAAAPPHPHRAAPPARPLRPHQPATAAVPAAARRHHLLQQPPRSHAGDRPAARRAGAGRPAAHRRPHLRAARITRPASGSNRPSPVPGRRPRGRARCRLSPGRDGRCPRPRPPRSWKSSAHDQVQALPPARSPARRAGSAGSSLPSPRSASPSPTSCCTAGTAIPTRTSPAGSPPAGPAAAGLPARQTCSSSGTGPAPPCKPPSPGRWRPGWTLSTSSATASATPACPPPQSRNTSPGSASSSCSPAPTPATCPARSSCPGTSARTTPGSPSPCPSCLHQQARALLAHASIDEPVTWEPPPDWVTGIPWPGPDPYGISLASLHPFIRAGLPVRAIAARLATTADHIRLTAARHPAPQLPPGTPAQPPPEPGLPSTGQLRDLTSQGHGPRKIARITGCSERTIRQLLTSTGLRQPPARRHPRRRPRRHRPHRRHPHPPRHERPGSSPRRTRRPGAFPPAVWNALTRPGAEQRIRRLLAIPGHPSLQDAARHLGIKHATLAGQVRQLEAITGITLLHTRPGATITLTADGEQFARDVAPVLKMLTAGPARKK
jgi:hypothetical protein